jgi:hypothetical protein
MTSGCGSRPRFAPADFRSLYNSPASAKLVYRPRPMIT